MSETILEKDPFGVGEVRFEKIINKEYVYVDKTALIHKLISADKWSNSPCFLSRPRRFGKTLLLDTIQNIFEGRRDLFSGLAIENLMGERWDAFPVIRISFNSGFKTNPPEELEPSLLSSIKREAAEHKIILDSKNSPSAMADLITTLSSRHKEDWLQSGKDPSKLVSGNVVVLIDEYDFPLIANIGNLDKCNELRLTLHDFYSTIKGCAQKLRFVFITGITKFRELSLFSAMNTVRDITLEPTFAGICGFTIDEIEKSFSEYLAPTLSDLKEKGQIGMNASVADLLKTMVEWYNGYTWDAETEVLNPLSVMSFFQEKLFKNYWYETGTSILTSRIAHNGVDYFKVFSKDLAFKDSLPLMHINKLNATVLLMQAGYLTISGITGLGKDAQYHLKIPNYEIRDSIRLELLANLLAPDKDPSEVEECLNEKYINLLHAFATHDEAECEFYLSTILAGIVQYGSGSPDRLDSHESLETPVNNGISVTSGGSVKQVCLFSPNEYYFRTIIQLLLELGNKLTIPESPSDVGRSDLAVQVPGNGWVAIEIKHEKADPAHRGADVVFAGDKIVIGKPSKYVKGRLEKMISAAFDQIIKKNYAKKYLSEGDDVYAAAMAVYGTSNVMVRFKKVVWAGRGKRLRS
ncbi:MAG: AAA family ATPase [Deltaproteobacteria bacterium]|nr:AAA family ATPase [Deltaproteobacteria bacterium]